MEGEVCFGSGLIDIISSDLSPCMTRKYKPTTSKAPSILHEWYYKPSTKHLHVMFGTEQLYHI